MNLDEFLTQGLIESLNNGLIAPELITVYAGNYLAKSLITADEMTQVQNAIALYKADQKNNSMSTSGNTSTSSTSTNISGSASASASESASASDVASEPARTTI